MYYVTVEAIIAQWCFSAPLSANKYFFYFLARIETHEKMNYLLALSRWLSFTTQYSTLDARYAINGMKPRA